MLFLILILIPYLWIILLIVLFRGKHYIRRDYSSRPTVSVFLPTCNEEGNVARKLDNLLGQNYPIHEVLVFDCSTDRTPEIVRQYIKHNQNIRLIPQESRIGVANTFNEFLKQTTGDIIVKTDCDSFTLYNSALRELVASFADPRIGGVSGICRTAGVEGSYRSLITTLQIAESNLDSAIIAHSSSVLAFQRTCVDPVDSDSMAEDTEEFVRIRRMGYRTIVNPEVVSQEQVPSNFLGRRAQKDRRAEGVVRVLIRNRSILFNPRYGLYGLIVFPWNFFLLTISPFLLVMGLIIIAYVSITELPVIGAALVLGLVAMLGLKRHLLLSLVDIQLSGLIGTINTLLRKPRPIWVRPHNSARI